MNPRDDNGTVSVTNSGSISTQGIAGIYIGAANGSTVSVDAGGNIAGILSGLYVSSTNGSIDISIDGNVSATESALTFGPSASPALVSIDSGAVLSSTNGVAISNADGDYDSNTTINAGTSVSGSILLNDGNDVLTFAGGDFSNITLLDGGSPAEGAELSTDILTFQNITGSISATQIVNWENVVVDNAFVSIADALTATTTSSTNGGTLKADPAFALNGGLETSNNGIFDGTGASPGNFIINGNVNNDGVITQQDGAGDDQLQINGNLSGSGIIEMDALLDNGSSGIADVLIINGDTSGTMTIKINSASGPGGLTGIDTSDGIPLIQVTGNSAATFVLKGGTIFAGGFEYSLVKSDGQNFVLQSVVALEGAATSNIPTMLAFSRIGEELAGEVRIGMQDNLATNPNFRLSDAIHSFNNRDNSVIFNIEEARGNEQESRTLDNRYHLAIGLFHHRIPGLKYEKLFEETVSLYCAKTHPLFNKPRKSITLSDLEKTRAVSAGPIQGKR